MNEINIAGLNAVEQAMRDDKPVYAEPKVMPKRFERRDTMELPIPKSATERAKAIMPDSAQRDGGEQRREGVAHSSAPVSHMDAMLEEKNSIHGDFTQDATTAQALKYVMRRGKNWEAMPPWMHEALEQMQTKVARILSGDFNHPDHWKDLQGYPRLVETRLEK